MAKLEKDSLFINKTYQKFFTTIETLDKVPLSEWTVSHSLAYICKKYKEKFEDDLPFSHYAGAISKSPEYKLTNRIWLMLQAKSGGGALVKEFIDWFYASYSGKRRFVSIGALAKVDLVSKFHEDTKKTNSITLSTPLPDECTKIIESFPKFDYVKTYGDLHFIKESLESGFPDPDATSLFNALSTIGFSIP